MIKQVRNQMGWLARLIIPVLAILFIGGCAPANQPPVISSLIADEEQISPYDNCLVSCVASDPDGDELSYTWSASGGNISGDGAVVTWVAPEEVSTYTITVKVIDGRGGEATAQVTIDVFINHPPVIDSLVTEALNIRRATPCVIECIASDPDGDELYYNWLPSRGSISGDGAVITWIAPNTYGTYTITVTVTDAWGDKTTDSMSIVVSCGCG
ncbi:MAG: hypothetical protein IMY88_05425 [Chloroflexi bacterium]|nr:hypothetical protein [Chloroflexota bacterium]